MPGYMRLAALLCFVASVSAAQVPYQNIIGKLQYSLNGLPFTGRISIQLTKTGYNICSSPAAVVPNTPFDIHVTNGVVSGGPYSILPNNCLAAAFPYFVQIFDDKGVKQLTDNWYFPQAMNNTIDLGTLIRADFGGPIQVAVPAPLLANSNISQSVTQPAGTNFIFNVPVAFNNGTSGITASAISSNGAGGQFWGMNSSGSAQGWFTVSGSGGGATCAGCNPNEVTIWNGSGLSAITGFTYSATNNFLDGRSVVGTGSSSNFVLATDTLIGQNNVGVGTNGGFFTNVPYSTATGGGLTANLLACVTSTGTVATCATNSTVWSGITTGVSGTAGLATITLSGASNCLFDNVTTIGDFVITGSTGQCHDSGSTTLPVAGTLVGQVVGPATSSVALVNIQRSAGPMYVPSPNGCGVLLGNYCSMANGVMTEWGQVSSPSATPSVTFNVPFTHGVQSITFGAVNYGPNSNPSYPVLQVLSTTGFSTQEISGTTSSYFWTAIGMP